MTQFLINKKILKKIYLALARSVIEQAIHDARQNTYLNHKKSALYFLRHCTDSIYYQLLQLGGEDLRDINRELKNV